MSSWPARTPARSGSARGPPGRRTFATVSGRFAAARRLPRLRWSTLALGIGVNTGIFTVVNAVLFRELPAAGAHELVSISQAVQGVPAVTGEETFSTSEYVDYRDRAQTLSGLAAYGNVRGETTLGGDAPRTILGMLVSCNYFTVLQQPPALGRALAARDCEPGADLVVVLSHELWRTVFEAEPGIVGRTIQMNRQAVTVAGVAAEGTYNGSPFLGGGFFAPLNVGPTAHVERSALRRPASLADPARPPARRGWPRASAGRARGHRGAARPACGPAGRRG